MRESESGKLRIVNDDALFPEGPLVRAGILYYAEYGGHRISLWDRKANAVFWERLGSGPSAIAQLGENYFVACFDSGEVAVVSPAGMTLAIHDKDVHGKPLMGPNDATEDGRGGLYFTLSGPWEPGPIAGRVMHMTREGTIREVADDLHFANGIARSRDGRRLLVNESEAHRVISFRIENDGSLSDRRLFLRMHEVGEAPNAYPDGIKLGPDGCYYIGLYSAGRIVVVNEEGKLLRAIEVPSAAAPNVAFSEDGKTLFVMAVDDKAKPPFKGRVYALTL
jgi:sugar lactone lactonase YvrE